MFLSSVVIQAEYVRKYGLVSRPALKNFVWKLFPLSQERDFLWKMKPSPLDGGISLLILSSDEPTESSVKIITKKIPPKYFGASTYRFSVETVPTKCGKDQSTGKQYSHNLYTEAEITEWFVAKASRSGFSVTSESIDIRNVDKIYINNRDESWGCPRATIDGILTVTDPVLFMNTATRGFGGSKGFGFGLMELKRV